MTVDEALKVIMELVPTLNDSEVRVIRQMLEAQWDLGFEFAQETVADWYSPEPPEGEED